MRLANGKELTGDRNVRLQNKSYNLLSDATVIGAPSGRGVALSFANVVVEQSLEIELPELEGASDGGQLLICGIEIQRQ